MPKTAEKRTPEKKRKKNESLALLRAVTKSLAGAIPGLDDDTEETIDDSLARPVSGFMSQYLGEDPETGELKNTAIANMKRMWNSDERRRQGMPPEPQIMPGIVQDTMAIPSMFGGGPQWAQNASASADRIHDNTNADMGLAAPQGFRQNALNAAGIMAGQLPVPGKAVTKAPEITKGALALLKKYGSKVLTSPWEFLAPTVEPGMANYGLGTLAGGALGTLGDEAAPEVHRAEGGKVNSLKALLKILNPRDELTDRHAMPPPVQEIQSATRDSVINGMITPAEGAQIDNLIQIGDEETLRAALIKLHERLFPVAPRSANMGPPVVPPRVDPGRGFSTETGDRRLMPRKAKGGKVKAAIQSLRALNDQLGSSDLATDRSIFRKQVKIMKELQSLGVDYEGDEDNVGVITRRPLKDRGSLKKAEGGKIKPLLKMISGGKGKPVPPPVPLELTDVSNQELRALIGKQVDQRISNGKAAATQKEVIKPGRSRISLEFSKPVSDVPGEFDYLDEHKISKKELLQNMAEHLEDAGIDPSRASEFRVFQKPVFLETDSGNISHAGAYWDVGYEGPQDLVDLLNKSFEE